MPREPSRVGLGVGRGSEGRSVGEVRVGGLGRQADDYGYCWPSQKKIAEKVCQGERTVRRHIATLRDLGLLTVIRRSSTRGRRSNGYQLHVGMKLEESLESRLPANLAGSGEPTDDAPCG